MGSRSDMVGFRSGLALCLFQSGGFREALRAIGSSCPILVAFVADIEVTAIGFDNLK